MDRCIGIDIGYGFVKITDGQEGYLFPSVVGEGSAQFLPPIGLQPPAQTEDIRVLIDGQIYFVGNLAIRHSRLAHRGLSATRVEGNNFKVLLLTALSLFCPQPLNHISVVTGLPPGRMHLTEELLRQVKGEHRVVRLTAQGSEEVTIRIERVTVRVSNVIDLSDIAGQFGVGRRGATGIWTQKKPCCSSSAEDSFV